MRKLPFFFVVLLILSLFYPLLQTRKAKSLPEGWVNRFTYQSVNGDNSRTHVINMAPQVFWDNTSSGWSNLLLVNNTHKANPHYLIRNSHITARIGISQEWDQEGVLYYDPDFTRRVCAEYWLPQAHINSEWVTLNTTFWSHEVYHNSTFINITGSFRVYYNAVEVGRMRISYILKPSHFLKHEVAVVNLSPQEREFRMVMRLIGIAGTEVKHVLGETTVTVTEQEITSRWLRFVNGSNPKQQFLEERLESLGHWEGEEWINDYLRGIRLKLVDYKGQNLVRCDIAIGNYTLAQDEVLFIDPDTSSWTVSTGANDAVEYGDGTFNSGDETCQVFQKTPETDSNYRCSGVMFDSVTIPQGSTIESANVSCKGDYFDDPEFTLYCHDVDDSEDFVDNQNIINQTERPRTTAGHHFSESNIGTGWYNFTSTDNIQEVINREGWSSGNNLTLLFIADISNPLRQYNFKNYENYANQPAILYVTWTSGLDETYELFENFLIFSTSLLSLEISRTFFENLYFYDSGIQNMELGYSFSEDLSFFDTAYRGIERGYSAFENFLIYASNEIGRELAFRFYENVYIWDYVSSTLELGALDLSYTLYETVAFLASATRGIERAFTTGDVVSFYDSVTSAYEGLAVDLTYILYETVRLLASPVVSLEIAVPALTINQVAALAAISFIFGIIALALIVAKMGKDEVSD